MIAVIKSSDRVYIGGRTGMGKSWFAKKLIQMFPRYVIYDVSGEYNGCGTIVTNLQGLRKCKSAKIVYQPQNTELCELDGVCGILFSSTNFTFLIDEIHLFATTHNMPPQLKRILVMGRKRGIGLMMVSQRPAFTNTSCLSQSNHIITFNLFLEADVQYFKNFMGEAAEKIRQLPNYHYLHYDIAENSIIERNKNGSVVAERLNTTETKRDK